MKSWTTDGPFTFTPSDTGAAARYLLARLSAALAVDTPDCAATVLTRALASVRRGEACEAEIGAVVMRLHEARLLLTEHTDQDDDGG